MLSTVSGHYTQDKLRPFPDVSASCVWTSRPLPAWSLLGCVNNWESYFSCFPVPQQRTIAIWVLPNLGVPFGPVGPSLSPCWNSFLAFWDSDIPLTCLLSSWLFFSVSFDNSSCSTWPVHVFTSQICLGVLFIHTLSQGDQLLQFVQAWEYSHDIRLSVPKSRKSQRTMICLPSHTNLCSIGFKYHLDVKHSKIYFSAQTSLLSHFQLCTRHLCLNVPSHSKISSTFSNSGYFTAFIQLSYPSQGNDPWLFHLPQLSHSINRQILVILIRFKNAFINASPWSLT